MNLLFFKKKGGKSVSGGDLDRPAVQRPSSDEKLTFKPRSSGPFKPASAVSGKPATTIIRDHQMAVPDRVAMDVEEPQTEVQITEIRVTLDSVIDSVPSEFLRGESATANMAAPVCLPIGVVLPQLAKGRISMPLRDLVALLPNEVLASPMPPVPERLVNLSLEKIVPQLPPQLFSARSDQDYMVIDATFYPTPFGPDPLTSETQSSTEVATLPEPETAVQETSKTTVATSPGQEAVTDHEEEAEDFDETAALSPAVEETPPSVVKFAAPTKPPLTEVDENPIVKTEMQTAAAASDAAVASLVPPAPPVSAVETTENEKPLTAPEQKQFLIDINRCTAEELTRIPGVGPSLAQRIIAFRQMRGQITDIQQLREIPGVGNKTFRRIIGASPSARGKILRMVNYLLDVPQDREMTLQEIIKRTAELPGVAGCIMAMEDGLFVTGHLPPPLDDQTVSAFGPQLFRRVSRYCRELQVGRVKRLTLFTDQYPVSIFHARRIYMIVIHQPNRFSKLLLRRCERIAQEINYMCTEHVTL